MRAKSVALNAASIVDGDRIAITGPAASTTNRDRRRSTRNTLDGNPDSPGNCEAAIAATAANALRENSI